MHQGNPVNHRKKMAKYDMSLQTDKEYNDITTDGSLVT